MDFRPIDGAEVADAHALYVEVFEWLKAKRVRQWLCPVPRDAFADRQRAWELFGLLVELEYPDGCKEDFDLQLFSACQLEAFARSAGLTLVATCAEFDQLVAPSAESPKMQCILERS